MNPTDGLNIARALCAVLAVFALASGTAYRPPTTASAKGRIYAKDTRPPLDDADQTAIRNAYDTINKAKELMDAEGYIHFWSSLYPSRDARELAVFSAFENEHPGAAFKPVKASVLSMTHDDAASNGTDRKAFVQWSVEDPDAFRTYEDTWSQDSQDWRFVKRDTVSTIRKAEEQAKVEALYRRIEQAARKHDVKAITATWSSNYAYQTKSGIVLDSGEAEYFLSSFLTRHAGADFAASYSNKHFSGPDQLSFDRSVRVPIDAGRILRTNYTETWRRDGNGNWSLQKTVVTNSQSEADLDRMTRPMRRRLYAAYRAMDRAVQQRDAATYLSYFAQEATWQRPGEEWGRSMLDEFASARMPGMDALRTSTDLLNTVVKSEEEAEALVLVRFEIQPSATALPPAPGTQTTPAGTATLPPPIHRRDVWKKQLGTWQIVTAKDE